jgi:hypothetical protein
MLPDPVNGPFEVTVTITVHDGQTAGHDANTIRFDVTAGSIEKIKVKAGKGTVVYDYIDFKPNPDYDPDEDPLTAKDLDQTSSDDNLNDRSERSQAVSHLDFCLTSLDVEPFTEFLGDCIVTDLNPDGCDPSGWQSNKYAAALEGQGFENETVKQAPVPAIYEQQSPGCGLDSSYNVINEYVARDCRVNNDGSLRAPAEIPSTCPVSDGVLDLMQVFNFPEPDDLPNGVFAPEELVGTPCIALLKGTNSFEFADFFDPNNVEQLLDDWTVLIEQNDLDVDDLNSVLVPGPVDATDPITGEFINPDLAWIEQAVLQVDDTDLRNYPENHALAVTWQVTNPKRARSGTGTVYGFGFREACVDAGPQPETLTVAYLEAVEDCKVALAPRQYGSSPDQCAG